MDTVECIYCSSMFIHSEALKTIDRSKVYKFSCHNPQCRQVWIEDRKGKVYTLQGEIKRK